MPTVCMFRMECFTHRKRSTDSPQTHGRQQDEGRKLVSRGGKHRTLETFMGVEQRTGPGTNSRIPRVVSKSDSDHGTATTAIEPLG